MKHLTWSVSDNHVVIIDNDTDTFVADLGKSKQATMDLASAIVTRFNQHEALLSALKEISDEAESDDPCTSTILRTTRQAIANAQP